MSKMTILGITEDRDDVLDALMRMGAVEIREEENDEETSSRPSGATYADNVDVRSRLKRMIDGLSLRFPDTQALSKRKIRISESDFVFTPEEEKEFRSKVDRYESLLSERESHLASIKTLEQQRDQLELWADVPMNLSIRETKTTTIIYGIFKDTSSLSAFEDDLERDFSLTALYLLNDPKKIPCRVAIITIDDELPRVRARLAASDYQDIPNLPFTGSAIKTLATLEERIQKEEEAIASVDRQIAEINEHIVRLMTYHDVLVVRQERLEAREKFLQSSYTFHLYVWVPTKEAEAIGQALISKFNVAYSHRKAAKGEETPVKLQNNRFVRLFEVILEMYGAPSSNETDPVPSMAPFYFILFGMMLSDVGYGAMLVAGTAWLLFKKKIEGEGRSLSALLFVSGISSVVWGFVFGGFFGDLLTTVTQGRVIFPALWFNPMDEPVQLLLYSMLFGVIHLFVGMAVNIRNAYITGDLMSGLADTVPWYLIIPGLFLILGSGSLSADPATVSVISSVGKWMAIAGAAFALLFAGHGIRNPIKRLIKGFSALYGVTSWLGDILSYSRILALVLATSVIAMVVNMLGMLFGTSLFGYIAFAVIALFGHTLNLALSTLSAFVHTSRLQYVEMFGKFFVGGGHFFKPLRRNTEYVAIMEGRSEQEAPSDRV